MITKDILQDYNRGKRFTQADLLNVQELHSRLMPCHDDHLPQFGDHVKAIQSLDHCKGTEYFRHHAGQRVYPFARYVGRNTIFEPVDNEGFTPCKHDECGTIKVKLGEYTDCLFHWATRSANGQINNPKKLFVSTSGSYGTAPKGYQYQYTKIGFRKVFYTTPTLDRVHGDKITGEPSWECDGEGFYLMPNHQGKFLLFAVHQNSWICEVVKAREVTA